MPVLLLNSTSVQLGRRIVTSPYPWPLSDVSVEEQDPIDFHKLTGRDVSVATAVHNTARFPYISAAGRLRAKNGENLGHLVDGGYFENTGADTLIDLLRYLKQSASPLNVRFIVVALLNSPPEDQSSDRSGADSVARNGVARRIVFARCARCCRPAPPAATLRCGACANPSSPATSSNSASAAIPAFAKPRSAGSCRRKWSTCSMPT